ncbi:Lactonase, 7-bladed beta-propeller-domain-containing protein [Amanita rubescens]|nr:Lactonase, 7-bladed beta-propeller-domain-containing protein [Amanita rubescens]
MVNFTFLAGGYDVFIASYLFCSETLTLSLLNKYPTGQNPSWISAHPLNKGIIYAVNEATEGLGAVQSFLVDGQGELTPAIANISSGGSSPPFVAGLSTGGAVVVVNYSGGNGRIIPTIRDVFFDDSAPIITFPSPVNGSSHPHMALEHNDEILVPDLGGDTIWRLARNEYSDYYEIQGSIPQPKGSGPRHIAIYEDRLYTLHELSSTLTVQRIPAAPNATSPIIASVSITPPNPPAAAQFAAAEILIPPPSPQFPIPYIYVSNRNTGGLDPQGDTIAIFEHVNKDESNEGLQLIQQVYTGLDQIRGMEFGPGPCEFLAASGVQGSAGVIILRRTDQGRNLEIVARNLDVPTRTSFVWL